MSFTCNQFSSNNTSIEFPSVLVGFPTSVTNIHGANLSWTYTPITNGYQIDYIWTPTGPWVYWTILIGTGPDLHDLALHGGTQTSVTTGTFNATNNSGDLWITAQVQNETNGGAVESSVATKINEHVKTSPVI